MNTFNIPPKCVIPIFAPGGQSYAFHGSAITVKYNGRKLLLTAAHVDDGTDGSGEIYYCGADQKMHALPEGRVMTNAPSGQGRAADLFDCSVLPVDDEAAALIEGLKFQFFELLDFSFQQSPKSHLIFCGFPNEKQKVHEMHEQTVVHAVPVAFHSNPATPEVYQKLGRVFKMVEPFRADRVGVGACIILIAS